MELLKPGRVIGKVDEPGFDLAAGTYKPHLLVAVRHDSNRPHGLRFEVLKQGLAGSGILDQHSVGAVTQSVFHYLLPEFGVGEASDVHIEEIEIVAALQPGGADRWVVVLFALGGRVPALEDVVVGCPSSYKMEQIAA